MKKAAAIWDRPALWTKVKITVVMRDFPAAPRSVPLATTRGATAGSEGTSQRNNPVAAAAPKSCTTMNPGTSLGRMPAMCP